MVTIKDVARAAGVSTTTVSRVINNKKHISAEVRRRVEAEIRRLGYRVNLTARSLVEQSSNVVGVVVADISNPPISRFVDGLSERLHEYGIQTLLGSSGHLKQREFEFLELFHAKRARGIIFTSKEITDRHLGLLNSSPVPVIVPLQEREGLDWPVVIFDNFQASFEVVQYLIARGHRRIGFVSCPLEDVHSGYLRQNGYLSALNDAGIGREPSYLQYADFTMEAGAAAVARMLETSRETPTAIFCATDLIAIGAMNYLRGAGIRVPDDICIFGFDNLPVSAKLIPSLSSVHLDHYELGRFVADLLDKLSAHATPHIKKVVFRHEIIVRESSG